MDRVSVGTESRVLAELVRQHGDVPSIRSIAAVVGCSVRAVQLALAQLEARGHAERRGVTVPRWHPTSAGRARSTREARR